jgi:uncharacterized membrane protein (UPF0127 family)
MEPEGKIDVEALKRKMAGQEEEQPLKQKMVNYGAIIKVLFAVIVILAIVMGIAMFQAPKKISGTPRACFKHDVCIDLIVVTTEEEQNIGLSNYTSLPPNTGMLFIFKTPDVQRMWMKDMNFPIDIFWIGNKGKIQHIEKKALPCVPPMTICEIFEPPVLSKYVLETREGFAIESNLYNGERVTFESIPK